jgi:hypothetical protein
MTTARLQSNLSSAFNGLLRFARNDEVFVPSLLCFARDEVFLSFVIAATEWQFIVIINRTKILAFAGMTDYLSPKPSLIYVNIISVL